MELSNGTKNILIVALVVMMAFTFLKDFGKNSKLRKTLNNTEAVIEADSAIKSDLRFFMESHDVKQRIGALKEERATLHNMNEIVLTNKRPAARIDEILREIDSLEVILDRLETKYEK